MDKKNRDWPSESTRRHERFTEKQFYESLIGFLVIATFLPVGAGAFSGHEILIHSPNITADESSPDFYEYSGFFNLDGSNLVWMNTWAERKINDKKVRDRIYLMNLSDFSTNLISEGPGASHENIFRPPVSLSGPTIVWSEFGRNDLFRYDTVHGVEIPLTSDGSASDLQRENTAPHVDGDRVVWSKKKPFTTSYDQDIVFQNLTTGNLRDICTGITDQTEPSISGSHIVWTDKRNEPTGGDIYSFDLGTGIETPVYVGPGLQQRPEVSGDIVVWQDYRSGKPEVYLRNITSGAERRISRDFFSADEPLFSGNIVTWMEYSDLDRRDERAATIVVYDIGMDLLDTLPVKTSHPQILASDRNRILYADPDMKSPDEGFVHLFIIDTPDIPPVRTNSSLSLSDSDKTDLVTSSPSSTATHPAAASFIGILLPITVVTLICRARIQKTGQRMPAEKKNS